MVSGIGAGLGLEMLVSEGEAALGGASKASSDLFDTIAADGAADDEEYLIEPMFVYAPLPCAAGVAALLFSKYEGL